MRRKVQSMLIRRHWSFFSSCDLAGSRNNSSSSQPTHIFTHAESRGKKFGQSHQTLIFRRGKIVFWRANLPLILLHSFLQLEPELSNTAGPHTWRRRRSYLPIFFFFFYSLSRKFVWVTYNESRWTFAFYFIPPPFFSFFLIWWEISSRWAKVS